MRAPFNDNFSGDSFDDSFMYNIADSQERNEIAGIMMEYFSQNEGEKIVAPDTTEVDYF